VEKGWVKRGKGGGDYMDWGQGELQKQKIEGVKNSGKRGKRTEIKGDRKLNQN